MTYVFDIDGTLCIKDASAPYSDALPLSQRINMVNNLYDAGHTIIMQTARGMGRHSNNQQLAIQQFYALTAEQLKDWGVKYHLLFLGKPAGDIYIDDKGIKDEDFFTDDTRQ